MKLLKRLTTSKPTSKSKNSDKDYEQLGRMLANIYETGYIDRNQLYKMSFIKGVITGFGGVVGATLVVALVIWILSLLGNVFLLDKIVDPISENIKKTQQ